MGYIADRYGVEVSVATVSLVLMLSLPFYRARETRK